jgi:hypothetical protein
MCEVGAYWTKMCKRAGLGWAGLTLRRAELGWTEKCLSMLFSGIFRNNSAGLTSLHTPQSRLCLIIWRIGLCLGLLGLVHIPGCWRLVEITGTHHIITFVRLKLRVIGRYYLASAPLQNNIQSKLVKCIVFVPLQTKSPKSMKLYDMVN